MLLATRPCNNTIPALAKGGPVMQSFIVAAITGHRDTIQEEIRKIDPEAAFENVPNLCTFWVATKLTKWSIECICGVAQVHPSVRGVYKIQEAAAKQAK
jgi:hypothetical protein